MRLDKIKPNPSNPRIIRDDKFNKLVKSLQGFPEMMDKRPIVVDETMTVLGGNMRLRALQHIYGKGGDIPDAWVVVAEGWTEEQKREFIIKDNAAFGEWDWDALAQDFNADDLADWGIDVPVFANEDTEDKEEDPRVEELLNEAMKENAEEFIQQVELMEEKGWIRTGLTLGACKAKFIRAKFYGEKYPQCYALYFAPEILHTQGSCHKHSTFDAIKQAGEKGKAGIAGLRTKSGDGDLSCIFGSTFPIADSNGILDFPSSLMLDLLKRYAPKNARVLDPCHGWGGRLIGSLLFDASIYVGIDPSPIANRAVNNIYNSFSVYATTDAKFIKSPFETCELGDMIFDIAITSPPYFDVEKYDGDETSTKKYPQFDLWVDGFYKPMIEKVYKHIKKGGVFCLQVGSQRYPLKKTAIEIAQNCGYIVEKIEKFGGSTNTELHKGKKDRDENNECVIVLRKAEKITEGMDV